MLSKISGVLFMATVDTQSDIGSINEATKTGTLNMSNLTLFPAK